MHSKLQNCTTDFILSPKIDIITYNIKLFATHMHKNGDFDHQKYFRNPPKTPRASIRERASNRNNTVITIAINTCPSEGDLHTTMTGDSFR